MNRQHRHLLSVVTGLLTLAGLIRLTTASPLQPDDALAGALFLALIVFTTTFSIHFIGLISLLPMTSLAAVLVIGLVPAAWAAYLGALIHGGLRHAFAGRLAGARREPGRLGPLGLAAANATMQCLSVLAGGWLYIRAGGQMPLAEVTAGSLPPLVALGLGYLAANYAIASLYVGLGGRARLAQYLHALPGIALFEGAPLAFVPLMALIYTRLGAAMFALFALILAGASLITRNLSIARQRLERRVKELNSLQAVGHALSTSLDIPTILTATHTQVAQLMPAQHFVVALCSREADEVAFPLVVEAGRPAHWRSRRTARGLIDHVWRSRAPLLIREDLPGRLRALAIEQADPPGSGWPAGWLGVPMIAGDEALGVMAVQSFSERDAFDATHQDVLLTIATQTAVALQNARLYAQTDEALARRLQELDSILRTIGEGVLLFDLTWRVVAANRTLADFLGATPGELTGRMLDGPAPAQEPPLLARLGYAPDDLSAECGTLAESDSPGKKAAAVLPGPPKRHVERTLAAVRSPDGQIRGWLLVFRDLSEERALARLREDLTHMLIHDLRAPLVVMISSMDVLELALVEGESQNAISLVGMARQGGKRLLHLINELLDISKLESGEMPVHTGPAAARALLDAAAAALAPAAARARIELQITVEAGAPLLWVDRELIVRALSNLLDNALKFTPDGGTITLWARPAPAEPGGMWLGVTDSGPGIAPEARGRLFQKFQNTVATGGRRRGTGLGLAFCKLVVEAHGGRIWVQNSEGPGATFVMSLPAVSRATST